MSQLAPPLPEAQVVHRYLEFFWIVDHSGSMSGQKIATVNHAIREVVSKDLPEVLKAHANIILEMRAIKFSNDAAWHVGPDPVPLGQFAWTDVEIEGSTATHKAIDLLATQLAVDKMPRHNVPPVCILLSDGFCDDTAAYETAIAKLDALTFGRKAVRLCIAIGDDGDYSEEELSKFITPSLRQDNMPVLKAKNAEQLISYIKWATVAPTVAVSQSRGRGNASNGNVVLAPPPAPDPNVASSDPF